MSESSSTSHWRQSLQPFLPTRRAWWWIAGACAAGVLLFLALWLGNRETPDFYRADGNPENPVPGETFEPLPAPLPAAADGASGMDASTPPSSPVRIDAHVAPTPPPALPPQGGTPLPTTDGAPGAPAVAIGDASQPRPVSSPAPEYPRAAMRRGEAGDVLLRVHVGANGRTSSVDVVRSSDSRRLDRAATAAVRRWRFEPAMRDGQPVPGELLVPFQFTPTAP